MSSVMSIPCEFNCASIYDIHEINSSFALAKLKVMYLGNNRNKTHFAKESVNKALPSLKNVPIVCHWDDETEEIGGHDIAIVSGSDGVMRIKNLTEPCGVVPDHAKFSFKKDTDEDGNEHEYLVIDGVILWKRQDVYHYIKNNLNGKVNHSMEVNVFDKSVTEDGYMDITNFEFTALCLLGADEPCFQGSEIELFSAQNFTQKMEQMMCELKECFSTVSTSKEDDIHPQNCSTEGGKKVLDEKISLATKYGIDIESLDFSIEDFTVEELEEKFSGISGTKSTDKKSTEDEKFALESNTRDEVARVLESEKIQREWGECSRYWFVDYDKEANVVSCWDGLDWLLYGFEYEADGDSINIKWETKKRKKYEIVDFEEGNQPSPFEQVFNMMEAKIKENIELEQKYKDASGAIDSMKSELDKLREFKLNTEETAKQNERAEVFARFEDLSGIEEFEALKEDCDKYNAFSLEEKCFAIRGKNSVVNFSLDSIKSTKLKVDKTEPAKIPYGGLVEKYGIG